MGQYGARHWVLTALVSGLLLIVGVWVVAAPAATDLRDLFTSSPDYTPYTLQPIRYAQTVSPLWLALTRAVDFSRPDADESRLHEAIMQSEGLPRHRVASRK